MQAVMKEVVQFGSIPLKPCRFAVILIVVPMYLFLLTGEISVVDSAMVMNTFMEKNTAIITR